MEMLRKFRVFCADFVKTQRGNVAIIFGLTMVPTMVLIGGLVDYGMAIKTKSQLVQTLDAAMLAAMLQYSDDENADYEGIIANYIDKNFTQSEKRLHGTIIEVGTPEISDEGEMKATITATVPTSFLKFAHFEEFTFTISSGVMVGGSSIEVALVLDNTGSMAGNKLTALKKSANDLVDIILPEDYDNSAEKIKFSIVPFADYVNVGKKHDDELGLDIPDNYKVKTKEGKYSCWNTYPNSTRKCKNKPKKWGQCCNDGVCKACLKYNGKTCTGSKGKPVKKCGTSNDKYANYKWHGCVGSRKHDLNTLDASYETEVPGIMDTYDWCKKIAPVTRLTADRTDIVSGISKMKARRETYIPGGLMWGWRSISPTTPFADGASYGNEAVRKVIVLMTDGANTKSAWGKWNGLENDKKNWKKQLGRKALHNNSDVYGHNGSSSSSANTITSELCANIKLKSIMVYTIGFEIEGGSAIENIMKACAGNGGQYYDADNETELADAFKEIGKSLLNLRLSH